MPPIACTLHHTLPAQVLTQSVILAIYGYRKRDWRTSSLPPFLALAMVGVISGAYHATLKGSAELGGLATLLAVVTIEG
jgi:hypothetical protein